MNKTIFEDLSLKCTSETKDLRVPSEAEHHVMWYISQFRLVLLPGYF